MLTRRPQGSNKVQRLWTPIVSALDETYATLRAWSKKRGSASGHVLLTIGQPQRARGRSWTLHRNSLSFDSTGDCPDSTGCRFKSSVKERA